MPCSVTPLYYGTASSNATHVPEGFGPQRKPFGNLVFHIIFVLLIYIMALEAFCLSSFDKCFLKSEEGIVCPLLEGVIQENNEKNRRWNNWCPKRGSKL
jgi:hypothetical protein